MLFHNLKELLQIFVDSLWFICIFEIPLSNQSAKHAVVFLRMCPYLYGGTITDLRKISTIKATNMEKFRNCPNIQTHSMGKKFEQFFVCADFDIFFPAPNYNLTLMFLQMFKFYVYCCFESRGLNIARAHLSFVIMTKHCYASMGPFWPIHG